VNVDDEEKIHKMIDLIDVFFSRGGYHVQINCQGKEVFIDAQKHPEKYRGLMVRVAGYVAYFVELPKELQDQIIGRTSHYV
jgi:formate C-acetyltransferase